MIRDLRDDFNRRFTRERYTRLLQRMDERTRTHLQIRVAETPVFLPPGMVDEMVQAGIAMTHSLLANQQYLQAAAATIPSAFRVKGTTAHPHFMTVDFGLVEDEEGRLHPRLVELQAFPSVYGYQAVLGEEYVRAYDLSPDLRQYLNGNDDASYWQSLRQVIVGPHDPENVILMEVRPERQKTLPDFHVHEDRLGIRTVGIEQVRQQGSRLFYRDAGRDVPIRRIYNRAIADEMLRENVRPGFDLIGDLDVEWAGHPDWYFLISKFSLPYLQHPAVPPAAFVDAWLRGEGPPALHTVAPEQLVLKPLFSFAGKGIEFAPTMERLLAIPEAERSGYLLQQRESFARTVATPAGMTQAEVRILYVWPDAGDLLPVNTLVRLGRGAMMGVDHNRGQEWVGGSAGLMPE